jgi:hypothetical protein
MQVLTRKYEVGGRNPEKSLQFARVRFCWFVNASVTWLHFIVLTHVLNYSEQRFRLRSPQLIWTASVNGVSTRRETRYNC